LPLAVNDVLLEVIGNGFRDAEILHALGHGDPQLLAHAEEVIDRVTACEDDRRMVQYGNTFLTELLTVHALDLDERSEFQFQLVLLGKLEVGRSLVRWCWLR